ncbi:hypothetical protein A8G90_11400 [Enterococcus faecium]|nr:hypothetical protein A8G90_11400 [Enterococcus faecium]
MLRFWRLAHEITNAFHGKSLVQPLREQAYLFQLPGNFYYMIISVSVYLPYLTLRQMHLEQAGILFNQKRRLALGVFQEKVF